MMEIPKGWLNSLQKANWVVRFEGWIQILDQKKTENKMCFAHE